MGSRCMTSKKASSIPVRTTEQQDNYVRGKTVAAEEIMRKSVWFIEKEEFDNYFSKEELRYYRKMQETSKKITEMQILMVPAEMRWREGEVIGSGAFGEVIMGFNEDNGQIMAVKQVNLKVLQNDDQRINALEMEIEILKQLKHENIVTYIGTQKNKNKLLIFLEYLSGGSISSLLKRYGKLNERIIRLYTFQILKGLEYLHNKNVMHRDIKGANILLENGGICKLADFGSCKQLNELNKDYHTLAGTVNWMPPEIITQSIGGRFSDIWSLGCTIIEMATGKPPWIEMDNQFAIMDTVARKKQTPQLPQFLSKEAMDFLEKCLVNDPFKRYNVYKLLRHNYITGNTNLMKNPDNLVPMRRNLKELSDIVEREENLSASSLHIKKNLIKKAESPKINVESEMQYQIRIGSMESPTLLQSLKLLKVNTAKSLLETDFNNNILKNNNSYNYNNKNNNEKLHINVMMCENTSLFNDEEIDVEEGEIVPDWNYFFDGHTNQTRKE